MTQPEETEDRIREGDDTKLTVLGHPVSTNEIHAVLLGLGAAVVTAAVWASGQQEAAAMAALALVGYAILGRPLGRSMPEESEEYGEGSAVGRKTIRHEPWWFLAPYAGGFAALVTMGVL